MDATNANRSRALFVISLLPGIHLRMLQRILGTSFSTVRYHVSRLEKEGEVVRRRDKRYERLYSSGTSEAMQSVYGILHRKSARKVLQVAASYHIESPTVADLASRTGLSTNTVAECIKQLSQVGLVVRSYGADGHVRCEVRDEDLVLQLLMGLRRNVIELAADNLIDLWDF